MTGIVKCLSTALKQCSGCVGVCGCVGVGVCGCVGVGVCVGGGGIVVRGQPHPSLQVSPLSISTELWALEVDVWNHQCLIKWECAGVDSPAWRDSTLWYTYQKICSPEVEGWSDSATHSTYCSWDIAFYPLPQHTVKFHTPHCRHFHISEVYYQERCKLQCSDLLKAYRFTCYTCHVWELAPVRLFILSPWTVMILETYFGSL